MDAARTHARPRYDLLPSIDALLKSAPFEPLVLAHGATAVRDAVRDVLAEARARIAGGADAETFSDPQALAGMAGTRIAERLAPAVRSVFNLTGTVIHTNLGRAPLAEEAIREIAAAAAEPSDLEYDLETGRRGDRDARVEAQVCRLTGAEAATLVNNNAAAVLLVLNTLAQDREVIVSRGELVEIGGAFRIPDVMARAGARLREVGTTNRTHPRDYAGAIGDETALLMKVHASNYAVTGFTAAVSEADVARIAHEAGLPAVCDLGSGTLVDLERYGLPHEPTPGESLAAGMDLVTFSGDKLLGGPQAGIVAGRADLVDRIRRNPMKRALRLDKIILAGLSATLRLYESPERLAARLPVLRMLTVPEAEIAGRAERLAGPVRTAVDGAADVEIVACRSQIGSGALPVDLLPSRALALTPHGGRKAGGKVEALARAFRRLPRPVIGRIAGGALLFDLRCLEDEAAFVGQLGALDLSDGAP
ncbi:L-seryl-tRNA(Sec) selenium transferase [Futiania mangrovi]|uniref:L-seryl-tRNA(Sec) selenium transferase n=1 Tax=Futiania mangrovi TaxID=2959716 RepID=A0A9J6PCH3_9PROT|nr:L-seryl-tRNA(Sec) selenium transferase [Futiania mangrovii]MCP1335496.1 L-seryl-tRNA(Sec) selenium transferase [Futiania mangrovii]